MKIYRVIEDSTEVLTTADELQALRRLRQLVEKHNILWGWIDESEVK